MENLVKTIDFKRLFDLTLPTNGLIKGQKIQNYFKKLFENKNFSDLKKPLYIISTDIFNSQEIVFNEGNLAKAVRASISVPGIFHPIVNNGRILVDGGVIDNLPIKILRSKGIRSIIAVNLDRKILDEIVYESANLEIEKKNVPNLMEIIVNTFRTTYSLRLSLNKKDLKKCLILTPKVSEFHYGDFLKADLIIQKGYDVAKSHFKEIKKLI